MRRKSRTQYSSSRRSISSCLCEGKNIFIKSDMTREIKFTRVKVQTLKSMLSQGITKKNTRLGLELKFISMIRN